MPLRMLRVVKNNKNNRHLKGIKFELLKTTNQLRAQNYRRFPSGLIINQFSAKPDEFLDRGNKEGLSDQKMKCGVYKRGMPLGSR